jgi:hypothetical protein
VGCQAATRKGRRICQAVHDCRSSAQGTGNIDIEVEVVGDDYGVLERGYRR